MELELALALALVLGVELGMELALGDVRFGDGVDVWAV